MPGPFFIVSSIFTNDRNPNNNGIYAIGVVQLSRMNNNSNRTTNNEARRISLFLIFNKKKEGRYYILSRKYHNAIFCYYIVKDTYHLFWPDVP